MLKRFRTSLGVGGTLKGGVIELQGDHRDTILETLRTLGYPAKAAGG
jgi:translation initiation factor 1